MTTPVDKHQVKIVRGTEKHPCFDYDIFSLQELIENVKFSSFSMGRKSIPSSGIARGIVPRCHNTSNREITEHD